MPKRLISLLVLLVMAACAGKPGAVQAVERYYQAVLEHNADGLSALTCADFEETARTELDSFNGVEIELQNLGCTENSIEGALAIVQCKGKIVASYGNEKMDFPLDERVHRVQNQDGDWRVCGY